MTVTLQPRLARFARSNAQKHGLASVSEYIEQLLEAEQKRTAEARRLRRQLRLAAIERYDEDRAMAEEWFPLEEEAYGKQRRPKARRGLSR